MNVKLAKRAVACKGWRWMPGMLPVSDDPQDWVPRVGELYAESHNSLGSNDAKRFGYLPDLDDPATRGCLLALVRDVYGKPSIYCYRIGSEGWCVSTPRPCFGATEAEALVAALEAAPEKANA